MVWSRRPSSCVRYPVDRRHASNIVHLAIAIASISIVIGRRWLWGASLFYLAIGVVVGLT
jgi:hypothetical protein